MDNYYNLERAKQAGALCETIAAYNLSRSEGKPKLGGIELAILKVLARKMGRKTDISTGEIENGCRASLPTLEKESLYEQSAIRNALMCLIEAGFLTKTYDRDRRGELTKEGQRRKERGMSLICQEKNNYMRQSMGRPRKDKGDLGQWKHCVYHLVPAVWDSVVFDTRELPALAPVSAEDQKVIDSIDDRAIAPRHTDGTEPTNEQVDEVIEWIKHYFAKHATFTMQSEKDARRSVAPTAQDLARRAITEGDLELAWKFLLWLANRHRSIYDHLMSDKVKNLCVKFGLPKYIADLWDEFLVERDDDYGQYRSEDDSDDEPEDDDQDDTYEAYEPEPVPVVKAKVAAPVFTLDEDDDEPAVDPGVLAEIEAERVAAEERRQEIARRQKEDAEATEMEREAQRKREAEAAEAERKRRNFEMNCRRVLVRNTDADNETFEWIGGSADDVIRVQTFLRTNFGDTVTITSASGTVLQAKVSRSLIAAWQSNRDGFVENRCVAA